MPAVMSQLITAEEFGQMLNPADGTRQELVKGEIIAMPPVKGRHGIVASRIDRKLGDKGSEAAMGTLLRRHHPGSPEYAAFHRGAFDE